MGVAGSFSLGEVSGVPRAQIGAVPGEHCAPLPPRVINVSGDEMGDVSLAATGHSHVGGRCGGVLTDRQMRAGRGLPLHTMHGAGVRQLEMIAHVVGGAACAGRAPDSHLPAHGS